MSRRCCFSLRAAANDVEAHSRVAVRRRHRFHAPTNIAADRSGRQEDPTLPRLFSGIRKIARGPRATRERTVIRPKSDRKRAHVAKDLTSGGLVRR